MTKSRGIKKAPRSRHGHCSGGSNFTPEYRAWKSMIERCENPRSKPYPGYGGRGISVHPAFRASFSAFLAEIGSRPSPEMSLDRKDNSKNYEPGNIRWATRKEQNRNNRRNVFLVFNGERRCVAEWAEVLGMTTQCIQGRMNRGWSIDRALSEPMQRKAA
jgi:hypothetical protein